jgi:hypothetical protein
VISARLIEICWNPDLSIYASESFLKSVGSDYGWIGGFDDSGKKRCILPFTIIEKSIFRMLRFRVETIAIGDELSIEEEKQFLNSAIHLFRSNGADMIIPATTNAIFRTFPDGADVAPYGTFIIDLNQPKETILSKFSSSHRRKVRLATKNGVEIKSGLEYIKVAYDQIRDTFKRSDLPFMNFRAFERFVDGLDENVKIFIAEHNRIIQGSIVVPFSKHSAYYVYGGSKYMPQTGATNLLHWHAMQYFKDLGVNRYDFVGVRINPEQHSKQAGLKAYKERFGGKLVRGYMWKYSLNPLKYKVYCLAVRLLRGGDIVDAERHKLGYF